MTCEEVNTICIVRDLRMSWTSKRMGKFSIDLRHAVRL